MNSTHSIFRLRTMASAIAIAASACPSGTFAQSVGGQSVPAESDASSDGNLSEIVVTAQKRRENLQNVPIAVTSVSGADLEKAAIDGPTGLVKVTPGLGVISAIGFFTPYLRGVGSQSPTLGLESSVATYADNLYLARPQIGLGDFTDVARVEVLKGPQGTLFGRNAAGGAIHIITNAPALNRFEGKAAVTYGRFDRVRLEGVLNVPLGSTMAARFVYYHDQNDGYIKNINPNKPRLSDKDIDVFRGRLLWEPSDKFKVNVIGEYSHEKDLSFGYTNLGVCPESKAVCLGATPSPGFYTTTEDYPFDPKKDNWLMENFHGSVRADWDIGPATLSSISGYVWSNFFSRASELDGTDLPYQHNRFHEHSKSYSQEFQAVSNSTGPFKYVAGLYYFLEKGANQTWTFGQSINDSLAGSFPGVLPYPANVGVFGVGPSTSTAARLKTESFAPYAQASYDFSDKFQLLIGGRYTKEKKTLLGKQDYIFFLPAPYPSAVTTFVGGKLPFKFNKFTPKVTLTFRPADRVMLYATYSVGFKSGGIRAPQFGQNQTVGPETTKSYEVGWKTQFGNVRFNGAAYYYDLANLQVLRTNLQTGSSLIENAADAEIYGLEADLTWVPMRNLELGAGGAWTHARFQNYASAADVLCVDVPTALGCARTGRTVGFGFGKVPADFSGRPLPLTPEYSFNIRGQYTVPLANDIGSLRFSGNFSYSSKYYYVPELTLHEKPHKLLSGSVTWDSPDEKLSLSLFGDNLLGQKYYKLKARTGTQVPAPPMTWGIRAGVNF